MADIEGKATVDGRNRGQSNLIVIQGMVTLQLCFFSIYMESKP